MCGDPRQAGEAFISRESPSRSAIHVEQCCSAQPTVDGKEDFTLWMTEGGLDTHQETVERGLRERIVKAYV